MPRDSQGRYTARRPRVIGAGRRLRITGVDYGTAEVGGVVSGQPIVLGGPAGVEVADSEAQAPRSRKSAE